MKIILVVALLVLVVWLIRSAGRKDRPAAGPDRRNAQNVAQPMLACAHCGVHVPRAEAVTGAEGQYCCADHRRMAEG